MATSLSASPAALRDPTSSAYKKARRQHKRSAQGRQQPTTDSIWTPFRAAEKAYKARFPPPDLSGVLDIATLDNKRQEECTRGGWTGQADAVKWRQIMLRGCNDGMDSGENVAQRTRKGYTVPSIPGLIVLPAFLSHKRQRELTEWALCDHAREPNATNLDVHYIVPPEGLWTLAHASDPLIHPRAFALPSTSGPGEASGPRKLISNIPASRNTYTSLVTGPKPDAPPAPDLSPAQASTLLTKLRWANIGWYYHWGTKQYDFLRGPAQVDQGLRTLCKSAVRAVPWAEVFSKHDVGEEWQGETWEDWDAGYEPDAGIVNFYQANDTLMAHVDRSEVCATSPLVSISLGCAAVFLIGGTSRDDAPVPFLLRSGDAIIMAGPACRRAYHGVPRILEDTLPAHLEPKAGGDAWGPFGEYLRSARINVNARQVFPRGFDPGLGSEKTPREDAAKAKN